MADNYDLRNFSNMRVDQRIKIIPRVKRLATVVGLALAVAVAAWSLPDGGLAAGVFGGLVVALTAGVRLMLDNECDQWLDERNKRLERLLNERQLRP